MKMKKNHLLTMTIMSLLGVSQTATADLFAPTTIAGKTIVIKYADSAEQNLFSTSDGLGAALLGQFQPGLQNAAGLITGSTINGVLVSIVNIGGGKVAIAQPQANGQTTFVTVAKSPDNSISALTMAQEYLNRTSTPGYVNNPAISDTLLTSSVSQGADGALLDTTLITVNGAQKPKGLIARSLADLNSAVLQAPLDVASTTINPDNGTLTDQASFAPLTDAKEIITAQVTAQAMNATVNAANDAAVTNPGATPVASVPVAGAPGSLTAVAASPVVQLAAAKNDAAASTSVVEKILDGTTVIAGVNPTLAKAAAADVNAANSIAVAAALTDPGLAAAVAALPAGSGVSVPTAQELAAASTAVSTATDTLAQQAANLAVAAKTDPTLAAAAAAATSNAATVAGEAAAAQAKAATALTTAPGASIELIAAAQEQVAAATAAVTAANEAVVANGGTLTAAQIQAAADAAAAKAALDAKALAEQNALAAQLTGLAKTAAEALIAQSTAVSNHAGAVTLAAAKADALTAARAALDAATAPGSTVTSSQKTALLNAYKAALTASQATAAAGKTAADNIVAAKLAYKTAQDEYVASLAVDDPKRAAEQAKATTAANELTAAQTEQTAAIAAVTDLTTQQNALTANTAQGGVWIFSSEAVIAAQAIVDQKSALVTTAKSTAANTKAAAATALSTYNSVMQNTASTAEERAAALQALVQAVNNDVAAQQAVITALDAKIAALQAIKTAAGVTAEEIAAAEAQIATANSDKTAAETQIAAVKQTIPMEAATIVSVSQAETNKVVAAIGTAGAEAAGVLAAQAALNTAVSNFDSAAANTAANQLAQALATVKTTQFQAKNNATSGTAGNPASAMSMMIDGAFQDAADFDGSVAASKSNVSGASADIGGVNVGMGVGLKYGYYNIDGKSINTVTMPLSVTAKFNPKHQLTLSVPLSYIQTQSQADAYQVGVSAAYKYNVTDNWSLTPAVSYVYRSFDNSQNQYWNPNSSTSLVGGTISSKYTWNFNQMNVSLINMIGHYQSLDSERNTVASLNFGSGNANVFGNPTGVVTATAANAALASYIVKNGLHATKMFGNFKVGTYFTDTEFFGSGMYFNQLNEFGFTLKPVNAGRMLDGLSLDANYLFSIGGKHSSELDGFRLNVGYKF